MGGKTEVVTDCVALAAGNNHSLVDGTNTLWAIYSLPSRYTRVIRVTPLWVSTKRASPEVFLRGPVPYFFWAVSM